MKKSRVRCQPSNCKSHKKTAVGPTCLQCEVKAKKRGDDPTARRGGYVKGR